MPVKNRDDQRAFPDFKEIENVVMFNAKNAKVDAISDENPTPCLAVPNCLERSYEAGFIALCLLLTSFLDRVSGNAE